ncbi:glyoxalase [Halalkalibacillus sediminis]|uniref:Glyoxalase n=1 Tax=Halalkalibacillus sediminis TaxID=2018042 RepID=A0A2I0QTF3_9BACI|nr:VOC family protein [Halalkalibacillus sediminis]PKR77622.1 glyoxalase [Halalkalibacillus sediminis]
MKFGRLMIFITNINEARSFYNGILGFEVTDENDHSIIFDVGGVELIAFLGDKEREIGDYSNESRSVIVFEVSSVNETFQTLKAKGVRFLHEEPNETETNIYAAFVDPFKNVHEIEELK